MTPKMILFDYGGTLLYEPNFCPSAGNAAMILPWMYSGHMGQDCSPCFMMTGACQAPSTRKMTCFPSHFCYSAKVNAVAVFAMPRPIAPDALTAALQDGTLSPKALGISAGRIAELAKKYANPAEGEIFLEETDRAAYNAAAEGSAGIRTNRNVSFCHVLSERFSGVSLHTIAEDSDTLVYVYSLAGREGNDRKDISLSAQIVEEWETLLAEADRRSMRYCANFSRKPICRGRQSSQATNIRHRTRSE